MKLKKDLEDKILFNYQLKNLIANLLSSSFLQKNPLYLSFYKNYMEKKMLKYKNIPFLVMIENTNVCNSSCSFCPHKVMKRKIGVMEISLFKKIVKESVSLGIENMTLHGFGEPLMDKNFFEKVKIAKEAGIFRVSTNTNGFLLNEKVLKDVFSSGLDEIFISLDAASENIYQKLRPPLKYSVIEKNIVRLLEERKKRNSVKPKIILSFVESDINKNEKKDFLMKWKDKVDHISISFIHNWAGSIVKKENFIKGMKDPCRFLWTDMVVSYNGDISLCCQDFENKIILGNLKNSTISEVWGGEKLEKIRDWHKKKLFKNIFLCQKCELNYHFRSPWWLIG